MYLTDGKRSITMRWCLVVVLRFIGRRALVAGVEDFRLRRPLLRVSHLLSPVGRGRGSLRLLLSCLSLRFIQR